jgi:hypothetical protein
MAQVNVLMAWENLFRFNSIAFEMLSRFVEGKQVTKRKLSEAIR